MDIVNSIANLSTSMANFNLKSNVSVSLIKGAMEQKTENIMKILDSGTAPVALSASAPIENIDMSSIDIKI